MSQFLQKIKGWCEQNLFKVISVPLVVSLFNFLIGLSSALKDGIISHAETQQLMTTASGFETILLGFAMLIWGKK